MTNFISTSETRHQNQEAAIKNLETQMGKLAKLISERNQATLPSTSETNPHEHVKAITLRGGKEIPGRDEEEKREMRSPQEEKQAGKGEDKPEEELKKEDEEVRREPTLTKLSPEPIPGYKPRIPYPQRLKQDKLKEQYGKFLELFKQLHINLPLVDALSQMPNYAKFLKDILSNKKKFEDLATVTLSEECSAILQNKLPQKVKDPGSFTIPCIVGDRKSVV